VFTSPTGRIQLLIGVSAIGLVLIWPLTPALSSTDQRLARIVCVLIAAVGSSTIALLGRNLRPIVWTSIAIVSGVAALAALYAHFDAGQPCIVDDSGQPTVIGRESHPRAGASSPASEVPDTSVPMSRKSRRWAERDVDHSRDARGLRNPKSGRALTPPVSTSGSRALYTAQTSIPGLGPLGSGLENVGITRPRDAGLESVLDHRARGFNPGTRDSGS